MWSNSRFSQHHQGLILADRLSMAMSIDTRDQIDRANWNSQILQEISYFAGILLFLRRKYYENIPFEERPATANSALAELSDISSYSQDPYHSSYYPSGKCFLWTLFFCSGAPQVVEPVYNEQGMPEWLRDAPYSSLMGWIKYRILVWFTKWNRTGGSRWTSLALF